MSRKEAASRDGTVVCLKATEEKPKTAWEEKEKKEE